MVPLLDVPVLGLVGAPPLKPELLPAEPLLLAFSSGADPPPPPHAAKKTIKDAAVIAFIVRTMNLAYLYSIEIRLPEFLLLLVYENILTENTFFQTK